MAKRKRRSRSKKTPQETLSKILAGFVGLLCLASFLISWYNQYGGLPDWDHLMEELDIARTGATEVPRDVLENGTSVHFIDVGQADSTLILSGGVTCLVDAGDMDSDKNLEGYLEMLDIQSIDYLVMTHPHADHIGSMDDILEDYPVGQVLLPDFELGPTPTSNIFNKVLTLIDEKQIATDTMQPGDSWTVGQGTLEVVSGGVETDNYNNLSPVLRFTSPSLSLVLSGDGETEVEQAALATGRDLSADIFQAGHHGSSTSNSLAFLQAIRPSVMVISCGLDNSYGHPHAETLENAAAVGAQVFRTDQQGSIAVYRDEDGQLQVWTEKAA